MARRHWVCVFAFVLALVAQPVAPRAQQTPEATTAIAVRTATADGVSVQYLTAGSGPAIVLLHGYAETSRMWRPLIPRLAATHTVIAPDLPGIGGSAIPSDGLDMTRAAARMHALVKSLGVNKAAVVGHDIGLMVAYAYAAQFPDEVDRLVLMDAFLPGVDGWEAIYNNPGIWHFRFNGPTPEAIVRGRERTDFARLAQTKLTMPVLSIGGEKANGAALAQQIQLVATNARSVTLPNTGHWVMEESPQATMDALVSFLLPSAATTTASATSAQPMSQASRSALPQMRWTPDEVRVNQTGTEQVGSSFLAV